MNLTSYLKIADYIIGNDEQQKWNETLKTKVLKGIEIYKSASTDKKRKIWDDIQGRIRTEEIKAWYSTPQGESLFQGTSISSLTIPYTVSEPINLDSITELENQIAESYISFHNKNVSKVKGAIQENIDQWIDQGLYYGVVICSKIISQVFDLSVSQNDVIFNVNSYHVDPHEILSYPDDIRKEYFDECRKKLFCFKDIDLNQKEFESSLVLADISKPKIKKFKDKILLAPVRCNEIASILSHRIVKKIKEKSYYNINPKSLAVVIYDTDTPYTYHEIMDKSIWNDTPVLPGLTVLGSSGSIDAFRWLYSYRISLLSQKIQKGSLFSQVHKYYIPFVFFGVLVWRDAEILLDMDSLSILRYFGNISPDLEFAYLIPDIVKEIQEPFTNISWDQIIK